MTDPRPHPQERSSAGTNHVTVTVDLRRRQVRELPGRAELREATEAARRQRRASGVTIIGR